MLGSGVRCVNDFIPGHFTHLSTLQCAGGRWDKFTTDFNHRERTLQVNCCLVVAKQTVNMITHTWVCTC